MREITYKEILENIDCGLESIKKRWKRYEKTIDL